MLRMTVFIFMLIQHRKSTVNKQDNPSMQSDKVQVDESTKQAVGSGITKISHCGNKPNLASRYGLLLGGKVALVGILNAQL